MVQRLRIILFYSILSLLLLSGGWGLWGGTNSTLYLICTAPFILFSTYFFRKKKIVLPQKLSIVFMLFFIISALSTVFSIHIQKAFESQVFYFSLFLIFLFVYNNAESIKKYFPLFILSSSVISLIYSGFLWFIDDRWYRFLPRQLEQLVYRYDNSMTHYPQGVFILFLLVYFFDLAVIKKHTKAFVFVGTLTIASWFSYLRAAHMSFLAVIGVALLRKSAVNNKVVYLMFMLIALGSFIVLFVPVGKGNSIPVISQLYSLSVEHDENLVNKDFSNGRIGFVEEAMQGIRERPLTGYGLDNFYYISLRYAKNVDHVVATSHNLFIDLAAETGVLSMILFLIIVLMILKNYQIGNEDFFSFSLFTALLVLFQFNYYQKNAYVFLLFFISAAMFYKEQKQLHDKVVIPAISEVIAFVGIMIALSSYMISKGDYHTALKIYPISNNAYRNLVIELENKGKFQDVKRLVPGYISLYGKVPENMAQLGHVYANKGDPKKALDYYNLALQYNPRETEYVTKVYELTMQTQSKDKAREIIEKHFRNYTILYPGMYFEDRDWFIDWCYANGVNCYYEESVRNN